MREPASRFRDDPWQRLPWLLPLALVVTIPSQLGFLLLLRQPSTPSTAPRPVDLQVVELPVPASASPARPAPPTRRSPPPPRTRTEASRSAPASPEGQVEAPRDPPAAAEESVVPPAATAATVPLPPASATPSPPVGPPVESPTAALPPSRAPQEASGGTDKMSARAIYKPLPEIPEALRRHAIELVAVARFRVEASGSAHVELIQLTNDPDLNRALLESLRRWRFFPAMQAGQPVASTIDVRIPISVK
jgi:protein TonB